MTKALVLVSGGMDSMTLLVDLIKKGYDVTALNVDYGSIQHEQEHIAIMKFREKYLFNYKQIDLSSVYQFSNSSLLGNAEGNTEVEQRNGLFIFAAASVAKQLDIPNIYIGITGEEGPVDTSEHFVSIMQEVICISSEFTTELHAPYSRLERLDIVKRGLNMGIDYSDTYSCYTGEETPCGKCTPCKNRLEVKETLNLNIM